MVWSRPIHSSAAADSTMAPARTISAMARSESRDSVKAIWSRAGRRRAAFYEWARVPRCDVAPSGAQAPGLEEVGVLPDRRIAGLPGIDDSPPSLRVEPAKDAPRQADQGIGPVEEQLLELEALGG